ncbi:organomercurial lyase [Halolamina salifodinae]|uniref:Alkylmercury lyase n=1 Tax=Halolamina salifodinae TaxID=1202767 RepID=A0A8T4GWV7_9EURY|nr:organomercurial lyase [Halolamina salifodinae]MBP1985778.1 hypothetical protein [Halolamina salifodinae]
MSSERSDQEGNSEQDERWLGGQRVLEAELPAAFRTEMSRFLDRDLATLEEWVAALRAANGGVIDAEMLCHADEQTPHWAVLDGETYHFQCFYDAVALARLRDGVVDIGTESPSGDVVGARSTGHDIDPTPSTAVVSFGIETGAATAGDKPTAREAYGAICPYVKAFPDRGAYQSWADAVNAETVAMPLTAGVPIAGRLVD